MSPFKKAYEVWKTNPTCRRIALMLKYAFALGFFFYWKSGVSLPGQKYLRLLEMELRFRYVTRKSQEGLVIADIVRYLNWKIEFAESHKMALS